MDANLHTIPYLGNGIGYRPELSAFIYLNRDKIGFVEIIAEHFMDVPDAKLRELELLKAHFTVIPHAINLSLGSAEELDRAYIKKLAELIRLVDPPYWSEHISYTRAHGHDVGHLSPIIYNRAFMEVLKRNIGEVRAHTSCPLILENITYHVELPGRDYSDAEFLNELCRQTGVGLLLDVANLYINSRNFGFDARAFLVALELANVVQLHYVGYGQEASVLTDTHTHQTQEEIFELIDLLLARHRPKGILLERDGHYERHAEISHDLLRIKEMLEACPCT